MLSRAGKEAVVAMLGPGDFFGEGALTGQSIRLGTATATMPTTVLVIEKGAMLRLLHDEPTFSDRFISYMLARNLRIEADLVDHLFNSSEKRLARTLLLLARYGDQAGAERKIPRISQETLAEMIGTTRSRVNLFMNKFRDLGFIEYNGDLKVNTSLLGRPARLVGSHVDSLRPGTPTREALSSSRPLAPAVAASASPAPTGRDRISSTWPSRASGNSARPAAFRFQPAPREASDFGIHSSADTRRILTGCEARSVLFGTFVIVLVPGER